MRDTRQLKEAITRKLWQLSSEKHSLDGAVAGLDRAVDDGMKATPSMSSSQNVHFSFTVCVAHVTCLIKVVLAA